jgi:SAM-dependent methyltransferase
MDVIDDKTGDTGAGEPAGEPDWNELRRLLARGYADSGLFGGVLRVSADRAMADLLSEARIDEQVAEMGRYGPLAGKRILEIGSGSGMLVVRGRTRHGLDIQGVEPGTAEYSSTLDVCRRLIAHYRLPPEVVHEGRGEALPFPDASFDLVYSSNVLEHVGNPEGVLDEALRVLRPGGTMVMVVPNYGSWWEGHYGILWWPEMPAWLAKLYVRALGRDPSYVDTLSLIGYRRLARWRAAQGEAVSVLDWGWEVFERRLRTLEFSEWAALGTAKRIARLVHRSGLLNPVIAIARRLHWQTPVIMALRKR